MLRYVNLVISRNIEYEAMNYLSLRSSSIQSTYCPQNAAHKYTPTQQGHKYRSAEQGLDAAKNRGSGIMPSILVLCTPTDISSTSIYAASLRANYCRFLGFTEYSYIEVRWYRTGTCAANYGCGGAPCHASTKAFRQLCN